MATMLKDALVWEEHAVPSTAAYGSLKVRIGRVGTGSPVGLLTASVHGDEGPWGTRAIAKFLESTPLSDLKGSLRVVPVTNPMGFESDKRNSFLDELDLNSSFPGSATGSHTQRLAAVLAEHAVNGADVVLDVHGGGSWNVNCFVYRFPGSEDVAEWMGSPYVINGPDRPTSLTGYARSRGGKGVWIEMGGRGNNEEQWAQRIATGLRRAFGKAGVLTEADLPYEKPIEVPGPTTPLRVSSPGIYMPVLREDDLGKIVTKGTVVGYLLDPVTNDVLETVTTPFEKAAMTLLRPTLAKLEGGGLVAVCAELK
ncbi:MAG TPA: M14 family metallopeptidase [Phototrophicaceae bacterium]|nr:M14 family metallopeptidase [Phototrophicaceae bacterium]